MWLTSFIAKNTGKERGASSGSITASSNGRVEVDSSETHRDLRVVAPFGIAYVAPIGEKAIVAPIESFDVCLGVVAPENTELEVGELMLYSKGGASVVLKNDGRVLINGVEFGG